MNPARMRVRHRPEQPDLDQSRIEHYTPRRLAQFLLENATDAADYASARREVRKLGLDPDRVPHEPPAGS